MPFHFPLILDNKKNYFDNNADFNIVYSFLASRKSHSMRFTPDKSSLEPTSLQNCKHVQFMRKSCEEEVNKCITLMSQLSAAKYCKFTSHFYLSFSKKNHQLLYKLNTINANVDLFLLYSWISINPGGSIQFHMPITVTYFCIRLHNKPGRQENPLSESQPV